jgi:hypothetical protein
MDFRLKSPPRLREKYVLEACIQVLNMRRYWVARLHAGSSRTADGERWIKGLAKGTPDLDALHGERPGFLVEVKRPGERPSPEQEEKHFEISYAYGIAIAAVDSAKALEAWLGQHEQGAR